MTNSQLGENVITHHVIGVTVVPYLHCQRFAKEVVKFTQATRRGTGSFLYQ